MYQNPNAGMAKFLSSIGDMRRTWEQEEQVRQQQKRAEEAHQQNIAKGALDMTLAQSDEARRVAEEEQKNRLRPGEVTAQELLLTERRNRNAELEQNLANLRQAYEHFKTYGGREAEARLAQAQAAVKASQAAAAASGAQTAAAKFELDEGKRNQAILDAINPEGKGRTNREYKILGQFNPMYRGAENAMDNILKFNQAAATWMRSGGRVPDHITSGLQHAWGQANMPGQVSPNEFANMERPGGSGALAGLEAAIRGNNPAEGGVTGGSADVLRGFLQLPPPDPRQGTPAAPTKPKLFGSREEPKG